MKCYITKCRNEAEYKETRVAKDEVNVCLVHLLEFLRGQSDITTRALDRAIKQVSKD